MNNPESPQFPIGKFTFQPTYPTEDIRENIVKIETFPQRFCDHANGLTENQLNTSYREGGWTLRQVIHHVADSHLNAYIRLKWTLTENNPTIKAYDEKLWAQTPENLTPIHISLTLLTALHQKWAILLKKLPEESFTKAYFHPETKSKVTLAQQVALYAWHGDHHLGHLKLVAP